MDSLALDLARDGFARLSPLAPETVAALLELAREVSPDLTRHTRSSDLGFEQLAYAPEATRHAVEARVGALLAPELDARLRGYRVLAWNVIVKRAGHPRRFVPLHQDFAVIDEREGVSALQLWIPLVDVDATRGALVLVPGSHLDADPIRPFDAQHELGALALDVAPSFAVQPALSAGDGLVFTSRTLHGSTPHLGVGDRWVVAALLVPRASALAVWFRDDEGRAALHAFEDAELRSFRPGEERAPRVIARLAPSEEPEARRRASAAFRAHFEAALRARCDVTPVR